MELYIIYFKVRLPLNYKHLFVSRSLKLLHLAPLKVYTLWATVHGSGLGNGFLELPAIIINKTKKRQVNYILRAKCSKLKPLAKSVYKMGDVAKSHLSDWVNTQNM